MENKPALCRTFYELETITAEKVGLAAKAGDVLALEILKCVGIQLGKGLSILIDLLNPEKIIIGSIFVHCYDEIWPWAEQVIRTETLSFTREVCQVVPSQLSETVGDIAALIAAEYNFSLEIK
jgi:glucokinase